MVDSVDLAQIYPPLPFTEIIHQRHFPWKLFYLFLVLFLHSLQDQVEFSLIVTTRQQKTTIKKLLETNTKENNGDRSY